MEMKVAVTYKDGEIFQHFGHCEQFKMYETEGNRIVSSELVSAVGSGHGAMAGFLKAHEVQSLICGGIGGGARMALAEAGIELYPEAQGNADACVEALLQGNLAYNPDTMCSHHHGEGHDCGNHSCGEDKHGCAGNH